MLPPANRVGADASRQTADDERRAGGFQNAAGRARGRGLRGEAEGPEGPWRPL